MVIFHNDAAAALKEILECHSFLVFNYKTRVFVGLLSFNEKKLSAKYILFFRLFLFLF